MTLATGTLSLDGMVSAGVTLLQVPSLALTFAALALVALAENARYPVDNPATHLELTMVHEAMILEYSGPYLAMLEYASSIKLTIFALLLTNFLVPIGLAISLAPSGLLLAGVLMIVKLIVVMGVLALLESLIAKMRFYRMQEYMTGAFFLALAGMIVALL